jgi:hypothetical protein
MNTLIPHDAVRRVALAVVESNGATTGALMSDPPAVAVPLWLSIRIRGDGGGSDVFLQGPIARADDGGLQFMPAERGFSSELFPAAHADYLAVNVIACPDEHRPRPPPQASLRDERSENEAALTKVEPGALAAVQHQLLMLILDLNPAVRLASTLRAIGTNTADRGVGDQPANLAALRASSRAIGPVSYELNGRRIAVPAPLVGRGSPAATRSSAHGASGLSATEPVALPLAPTIPSAVDPDLRERLLLFYEVHNEYKLPSVAATLRQYEGHETALFRTLELQYGPAPTSSDLARLGLTGPLPPGWERVESTRGDVYYRHSDGRRQWTRPRQEGATQAKHIAHDPAVGDQFVLSRLRNLL